MSRFALNRTRPHSIASYANQSYLTSYLKSYLKKKKDGLVFLEHGTGIKLGYSGILWNPVALLLWFMLL